MGMAWGTLPADVCWALNEYERQRAVLGADCATPAGKGVAFGHCFPSFFPALRAYKVKGKVETFLKKSFIKKLLCSLRSAQGWFLRSSSIFSPRQGK